MLIIKILFRIINEDIVNSLSADLMFYHKFKNQLNFYPCPFESDQGHHNINLKENLVCIQTA